MGSDRSGVERRGCDWIGKGFSIHSGSQWCFEAGNSFTGNVNIWMLRNTD